jgi:Aldo/keto reductases, related to diketogulonate reductase
MIFLKDITLHNGVKIPAIGLGTFRAKENDAYEATLHALKVGYRHIDTAAIYDNEEEVGRAIKDSNVPRDEIFVTSKLWNTEQGYESAKAAYQASLDRLGLDYLDLYLIHWPKTYEKAAATWKAFEELYEAKKVRAIGVSNFLFHHIEHLLETAKIVPMVNQVETHLFVQNKKLYDFCMGLGIYLEGYAPLASHEIEKLLANETLQAMAEAKGCTIPQIALKYQLDRDIIIIPKSKTPSRIEENLNLSDITFTEEEREALAGLNNGRKFFPDPDNIAF